ncbi:hypothetical protein CLF_108263 [Clonorchis sinensis]|uniref:Uncharacterized protein n=1 Tax=Clonorchis sinensis TaxID=79923 RepID=G7YRF9_CLOSI|nr:hypothetical protein CLF_108263 [Clonorchis sinensis]
MCEIDRMDLKVCRSRVYFLQYQTASPSLAVRYQLYEMGKKRCTTLRPGSKSGPYRELQGTNSKSLISVSGTIKTKAPENLRTVLKQTRLSILSNKMNLTNNLESRQFPQQTLQRGSTNFKRRKADLREDVLLTCLISSIHRYTGIQSSKGPCERKLNVLYQATSFSSCYDIRRNALLTGSLKFPLNFIFSPNPVQIFIVKLAQQRFTWRANQNTNVVIHKTDGVSGFKNAGSQYTRMKKHSPFLKQLLCVGSTPTVAPQFSAKDPEGKVDYDDRENKRDSNECMDVFDRCGRPDIVPVQGQPRTVYSRTNANHIVRRVVPSAGSPYSLHTAEGCAQLLIQRLLWQGVPELVSSYHTVRKDPCLTEYLLIAAPILSEKVNCCTVLGVFQRHSALGPTQVVEFRPNNGTAYSSENYPRRSEYSVARRIIGHQVEVSARADRQI